MAIFVDDKRCNHCGRLDEPLCVRDCPGDLMVLRTDTGKAAIRDNGECWDCAACVKVCPTQAIHMRLPTQVAIPGVALTGRALKHKTVWKIRMRDGAERTFETPSTGEIPFAPAI